MKRTLVSRRAIRIDRRLDGITNSIDHGNCWSGGAYDPLLNRVSVIPVIEVSEDAVACARRQHEWILCRSAIDQRHIPQREEECFVFNDRSAYAACELMGIGP